MGTGAKAGIAAAIVVLAVAVIGFCLWRFKFRKSKKLKTVDNIEHKPELEGEGKHGDIQEAHGKRRSLDQGAHETRKDPSNVGVDEVGQTPPAELPAVDPFGRSSTVERGIEQGSRAELPSLDPCRPELESPGLELIRSELSTPEPPSELSTADPSLVAELTSRDMAHELPSSNRNSGARPTSYRNDSHESEIFPSESASTRPGLHSRKSSQDTIGTPVSPHPRRESIRGFTKRQHSGLHRPRLNSSSSHDTFETRYQEFPFGLHTQGSPSPLASPPLGSQPSPSLSALNSPKIPHPHRVDSGPPTPGPLDLTEQEPSMSLNQQQASRGRFTETLTADPEMISNEEKQRKEEARVVVKQEVERIEDRARSDVS